VDVGHPDRRPAREADEENDMRVMVLVKADEDVEAGTLPPPEAFAEMGKFNEQLLNAGVMLAADGLTPSSKGKRVAFDVDGSATVIDGPFTEAKELVAGFWIWQVSSLDEALEWIKRSPFRGTEIELRPIMELEELGDHVPEDVQRREQEMRGKLAAQ
jgi:hypothetical protein